MTQITVVEGDQLLEVKTFAFRFQARTWLLLNGYLFDGNGMKLFEHVNNGTTAELNSRGMR